MRLNQSESSKLRPLFVAADLWPPNFSIMLKSLTAFIIVMLGLTFYGLYFNVGRLNFPSESRYGAPSQMLRGDDHRETQSLNERVVCSPCVCVCGDSHGDGAQRSEITEGGGGIQDVSDTVAEMVQVDNGGVPVSDGAQRSEITEKGVDIQDAGHDVAEVQVSNGGVPVSDYWHPDYACPQLMIDLVKDSVGIGHRFTAVMLAAKTAKTLNVTLVLDLRQGRDEQAKTRHGTFPLFERLYGLGRFILQPNLGAFGLPSQLTHSPDSMEMLNVMFGEKSLGKVCNIVVETKVGHEYCHGSYCFHDYPGLFNEMKDDFRLGVAASGDRGVFSAAPDYFKRAKPQSFTVVWHVRSSDVSLHANEPWYFENVLASIERAGSATDSSFSHFVVFGEKDIELNFNANAPAGFESLATILPGVSFISSPHAEMDIYQFTTADILVGSGSSFVNSAAAISYPSDLIFLYPPPKECNGRMRNECGAWETYYLNDSIVIDKHGRMGDDMYSQFETRLKAKTVRPRQRGVGTN